MQITRPVLVATAILVTSGLCAAYLKSGRTRSAHLALPVLIAERQRIEFDALQFGERQSQSVRLRNMGEKTIKITRVIATCGCTEATIDHKLLDPGHDTTLRVTAIGGLFNKSTAITIESDRGSCTISVVARAASRVRFSPEQLDCGRIDTCGPNIQITASLFLLKESTVPLDSLFCVIDGDDRVKCRLLTIDQDAKRIDIMAEVTGGADAGEIAASVKVASHSSDFGHAASIIGYVPGPVFADPKMVRAPSVGRYRVTFHPSNQSLREPVIVNARFAESAPSWFKVATSEVGDPPNAITVEITKPPDIAATDSTAIRTTLRVDCALDDDRKTTVVVPIHFGTKL
jgi:hypothetical protein